MLFFVVINCMSLGQGKGTRRGMGAEGEMVAREEIEQLTVSVGLVWREARHCTQKATTPKERLFYYRFSMPFIVCVYVHNMYAFSSSIG